MQPADSMKNGNPEPVSPVRVTVRYEGLVQGVGFRFAVRRAAQGRHIAGFVRNEDDGSVLLSAEGEESELTDFLDAIRRTHVGPYITAEHPAWTRASGSWKTFQVEF
jgi:acylphosphatase